MHADQLTTAKVLTDGWPELISRSYWNLRCGDSYESKSSWVTYRTSKVPSCYPLLHLRIPSERRRKCLYKHVRNLLLWWVVKRPASFIIPFFCFANARLVHRGLAAIKCINFRCANCLWKEAYVPWLYLGKGISRLWNKLGCLPYTKRLSSRARYVWLLD